MPGGDGTIPIPARFPEQVYAIVRVIPPGRVMTYGRIAGLIPPPGDVDVAGYERVRARWVGYALAACSDDIPWHRVVNAQGRISPRPGLGPHEQRALLGDEGVKFSENGNLDLGRYGWEPDATWLEERKLMAMDPASGPNEPGGHRNRTAQTRTRSRKQQY